MNWVIDTNILIFASNVNEEKYFNAVEFVLDVRKNHSIVIDHKREIVKEYNKKLKNNPFYKKWWKHMISTKGKIAFHDSKIPSYHKNKLENLKFHNDDLLFVGVASNSCDKLLVTEDKDDYNKNIRYYLKQNLDINVYFLDNLPN